MSRETAKSPAEIESEIGRTRSEMGQTLSALQDRLSPGQLLDGVVRQLGSGSGEFAGSLGRTVRANPVPVALMGIGLGWLMISAGQGRSGTADSRGAPRYAGPPPGVERVGRSAAPPRPDGGAGDKGASSDGRARRLVDGVRERADGVRQRAADVGEKGRRQAAQARRRMSRFVDEQPLLLGVVGVAIGAVLGSALPATRRENRLLGETRDRLKDQAVESGKRRMGDVEQVVDKAVRSAKDEAKKRGLVPPAADESSDGTAAKEEPKETAV